MDNRPYIKWHAEKLKALLDHDPNCTIAPPVLLRGVEAFLGLPRIKRIDAQSPPGITVESE